MLFSLKKSFTISEQELHGDLRIKDDEATYRDGFPKHFMDIRSDLILLNKTADFMRKFRCETFENLDKDQLEILRENSNTVVYEHLQDNDYLVATESSDMPKLKQQLFPQSKSPRIEPQVTSKPSMGTSTTSESYVAPSTTSKPSTSISVAPKPYRTTCATSEPLTTTSTTSPAKYSIEQVDQRNMFSIKRFENDLQEYFKRKFHVELVCKRMKTNIRLEVSGEMKSVEDALNSIDQLFSSLRTKQFNDKSGKNRWERKAK